MGRLALGDLLRVGMLPVTEVLVYAILFNILLRFIGQPALSALTALVLTEGVLVGLCILVKQVLVGGKWGTDHSTPFWSWRHFTYFFAQDCYFVWCRRSMRFMAGTLLANPLLRLMGCRVGRRTLVNSPLQAFDWNAVSFGDDCIIDGILQFHTFENRILKVKRTDISSGTSVNFGATVMGGASIDADTTLLPLSLVLKEMHLQENLYQGSPAEPVTDRGGGQ